MMTKRETSCWQFRASSARAHAREVLSPNCSERRDDVAVGLERTKMVSKAREQSWRV